MNIDKKQIDEWSKTLSYVLRHAPQTAHLELDQEGWADIDALIAGIGKPGHRLDRTTLQTVVDTNDKKRFAISDDGRRIRALQGHSVKAVQRDYEIKQPPDRLYHGTATRFLDSIMAEGQRAGARRHVHLSQEIATALAVGRRYGQPVILDIDARRMHEQGFRFMLSENGVWLTEHVPVAFIRRLEDQNNA